MMELIQTKNFIYSVQKQSEKLKHGITEHGIIVANCGSDDASACDERAKKIMDKKFDCEENYLIGNFLGNSLVGFGINDGQYGLFKKIQDDNFIVDVFAETIKNVKDDLICQNGNFILMRHDNGVPFVRMIDKIVVNQDIIEILTIYSKEQGKEIHDTHHYSLNDIHAKFLKLL